MHSLATATELLNNSHSAEGLAGLLSELGFRREPILLSKEEAAQIGLASEPGPLSLTQGDGAMRAIMFRVTARGQLRTEVARVAARLLSRAPHLLWVIAAFDSGGEMGIAACEPGKSRARVVALVAKPGQIVRSDAETVCALAAARGESDMLVYARWLEILGRESVSRRFFRALEGSVANLARDIDPSASVYASELALLYTSRLLFLSFLETKGWLDRDHGFLSNRYADCMVRGGGYHQRVLVPLFFGTLNTHPRNRAKRAQSFGRIPFLNGGLFSRSRLERRFAGSFFSDESLGDLFADVLTRYRFTAREDATSWSEAAIDPEMLGRAFESLMSVTTRKKSGAFYTPQSLVVQLTRSALTHGLSTPLSPRECVEAALAGEAVPKRAAQHLLERVTSLRLLDPACGSGAFLVHVLEEISALRSHLGDHRHLHEIRRAVLTSSIFGVDVNPTAVWLCELRLWLCMAIENPESDPMRVPTLPNLDRHIRVGDSLLADAFDNSSHARSFRKFSSLRSRYSRAAGPRKQSLGRMLDKAERQAAIEVLGESIRRAQAERREIVLSLRSRDLFGARTIAGADVRARMGALRSWLRSARREWNAVSAGGALPFSFATHFADASMDGGFDIVIGNPPWVRTHNVERSSRVELRRTYSVYRNAAWQSGAEASGAGRGFSAQVDVAALFVERCVALSRRGGVTALIVPAKLWRSLAGGGVRALLTECTEMLEIHDLTEAKQVFDAAVYPSLIVARGSSQLNNSTDYRVSVTIHKGDSILKSNPVSGSIPFDDTRGSPWIMLPPDARTAFNALIAAGIPLSQSRLGRPSLGVKSGFNEAFIVPDGHVEPELLRPLVRGEDTTPWTLGVPTRRIIWTHDASGRPLLSLPPRALEWLSTFRSELESRSDAQRSGKWWSLFRTESADFSRPRVVWSDVARAPKAALIPAGDNSVAINSCYVVRCSTLPDALALTALLNSPVIAAWLNAVAEPARGGYHRYLGWTMSILPLPKNWKRATSILAPIASRAIDGIPPDAAELIDATAEAYGICETQMVPLLAWSSL